MALVLHTQCTMRRRAYQPTCLCWPRGLPLYFILTFKLYAALRFRRILFSFKTGTVRGHVWDILEPATASSLSTLSTSNHLQQFWFTDEAWSALYQTTNDSVRVVSDFENGSTRMPWTKPEDVQTEPSKPPSCLFSNSCVNASSWSNLHSKRPILSPWDIGVV